MNNNDIIEKTAMLASEAFAFSIEALTISKAIHDLVLTDEQKAMMPKLVEKHRMDMANRVSVKNDLTLQKVDSLLETFHSILHEIFAPEDH
jgi:hypothetical protein